MKLKKYVVLISTIILLVLGVMIEDRGLAIQVTSGGTILYPISSGGNDGAVLKLGLYLFSITALYSIISILRGHREAILLIVYLVNSLIYAFFLFLVMMDSSIIEAALLGDWLPLCANIIWVASFVVYVILSILIFNKSPLLRSKSDIE